MGAFYTEKILESYEASIKKGLIALLLTLRQYIKKDIELERMVRVAFFLRISGASKQNSTFQKILEICLLNQKVDGGWVDVEDSAWSVAFLKTFEEYSQEYQIGWCWLKQQELKNGGWGRSNRDIGRIPVTGILLYLLPDLSNRDSLEWLENEWRKDFVLNPKLTYKAALFLMSLKSTAFQFANVGLRNNTVEWLVSQQNEDYGWGPCKGHPVESTPFCTGVALIGLLQYPDKIDQNVIANGLKWIKRNQLGDGLWADHYIEEGSAWCFYALTEGYKFLKGSQ